MNWDVNYECVVLDLDLTVWTSTEIWIDHMQPPFRLVGSTIEDRHGEKLQLYAHLKEMLEKMKAKNLLLAIASKTTRPDWARQALELFEIDHYFDYQAIYPDRKTKHLEEIRSALKINYSEMMFFDDEALNIQDGESLGVKSIYVDGGLSTTMLNQHLGIEF